jgi:hypothetical protein
MKNIIFTIAAVVVCGVSNTGFSAGISCSRTIEPLPSGGVRWEIYRLELESGNSDLYELKHFIMKDDGKTYSQETLITSLKCTIKEGLAGCSNKNAQEVEIGHIMKVSGGELRAKDHLSSRLVIENFEGRCREI